MGANQIEATRRGKYATLLDPELWDYIDQVNAWFPPGIAARPIAEQRAVYNAMCRAFHQGCPAGVTASDDVVSADGRDIAVRRYRMAGKVARAIVVYYHGGGFV
ncbi:MAG: esterase, partial [Mesorhizobium sp.]